MTKLFPILLLLTSCALNVNNENDLTTTTTSYAHYFNPSQLFDQRYPENLTNVNYYDIIPKGVRDDLPFGYDYFFNLDSVKINHISSIETINFDDADTTKGRIEFDKHGNVMYAKSAYAVGGTYLRYLFSDSGRLVKRCFFDEDKNWYCSENYHYNTKGQVIWVVSNYPKRIDSIPYEYDDKGNMTRAGKKTFKYDKDGNCIEWNWDLAPGHCGNVTTHWTGRYDKNGKLIESESNSCAYALGEPKYDFKYVKEYSPESRKLMIETVYEGKTLFEKTYYHYY
jgi:hypothetical protein